MPPAPSSTKKRSPSAIAAPISVAPSMSNASISSAPALNPDPVSQVSVPLPSLLRKPPLVAEAGNVYVWLPPIFAGALRVM